MDFLISVFKILDLQMTRPEPYGWFHIMWLALTVVGTVLLCKWVGKGKGEEKGALVRRIVLVTAVICALLELYKQIVFTFELKDGTLTGDYQWYAFPFQFCSMPMLAGVLTGFFKRGRVHRGLMAFLASYSIFAGFIVMLMPTTVFVGAIGVNIETMFCHASMIPVGVMLLHSGYVAPDHSAVFKAMPVFGTAVALACIMNEIAHASGLLATEEFNMFYVSPYCAPSLPVYSSVQAVVPYPLSLIIYVVGFSLAAYIMVLIYMVCHRIAKRVKAKRTV